MITAVVIKNVELPSNINEQMSGKTLVISSVAEQKMNQQSDMQQVQAIIDNSIASHKNRLVQHRFRVHS